MSAKKSILFMSLIILIASLCTTAVSQTAGEYFVKLLENRQTLYLQDVSYDVCLDRIDITLLTTGQLNGHATAKLDDASLLYDEEHSIYKMWVLASTGANNYWSIYYAESQNLTNWNIREVLYGTSNQYDADRPNQITVLKESDTDYKMWYSFYWAPNPQTGQWSNFIYYRNSSDGINWGPEQLTHNPGDLSDDMAPTALHLQTRSLNRLYYTYTYSDLNPYLPYRMNVALDGVTESDIVQISSTWGWVGAATIIGSRTGDNHHRLWTTDGQTLLRYDSFDEGQTWTVTNMGTIETACNYCYWIVATFYAPEMTLMLTKVDDITSCADIGENITYSICYAANGYSDTDVVIIDELSPEVEFISATGDWTYDSGTVTWNIGTLEPDESDCLTLVVQVNTNAVLGGTIRNECEMRGSYIGSIYAEENTTVCKPIPPAGWRRHPIINMDSYTINVDFNVDGDANAYTGKGAYDTGKAFYDDGSRWRTFCKGWGKPIGSPRSSHLGDFNEPNNPAIYARQIWIGDNNLNCTWYRDADYPSPGLMNDGFKKTGGGGDPNIRLWGRNAYQGMFDIYVYSSRPGSFTLSRYGVTATKFVTGGVPAGQFVLGGNYVIFPAVNIDNINPDDLFISYANVINGLQLVGTKQPVAINKSGTVIPAGLYDAAGEWSGYAGRQNPVLFGPSLITVSGWPGPGPHIGQIDRHEYMEYDISVDGDNKGRYSITVDCVPYADGDAIIGLFLDDVSLGTVTRPAGIGAGPTTAVEADLVPGRHAIKWMHTGYDGSSTGYNILDFNFVFIDEIQLSDCDGVRNYNLLYKSDLNKDCYVDRKDLDIFTDLWLECDDPNWRNCK